MTFTGKRHDYIGDNLGGIPQLEKGWYGKDANGGWWARLPVDSPPQAYSLDAHKVEEHEDGTISVSPSIQLEDFFHGYLKNGEWSW